MPGLSLAVCACTYKRPDGLRALLAGLAGQELRERVARSLRVIIADNEGCEQVRAICAKFDRAKAISVAYVHEPRRGIPFARNACLDHLPPDCDFFAFIDDDEVPAPDWLDQLLMAQAATDADVIAGRVVPVFPDGTPGWIASGGFFGAPRRSYDLDMPRMMDGQELDRAATNNVLVRAAHVRRLKLRFDESIASSGGEDTLFFRTLHQAGTRIAFSEHAIVYDHIPLRRANVRYIARERFRIANINTIIDGMIDPAAKRSSLTLLGDGFRHIGLGFRRLFRTALSKKRPVDRFAVGLFQMAHGLGIIAAALGIRYQHYK